MNLERVALGISIVACLLLAGWNVRLQGQLADLRTDVAPIDEAPVAVQTERPARGPGAARTEWGERPRARGAVDQEGAREVEEGNGQDGGRERPEPDWDAIRAEMEVTTTDVIEGYATQSSWTPELTEEVLAIYLDSGEAIGEVWARMGEGETTHYQARKEMREIRDESAEELIALIGEPAHEAIEEHLWEARREVWRRTHRSE